MSAGYIYILSNESIPGKVKIGMTNNDVEARSKQLYSTGVPTPFKVEASFQVDNALDKEQAIHKHLAAYRTSFNREFFDLSPRLAIDKVSELLGVIPTYSIEAEYEARIKQLKIKYKDKLNSLKDSYQRQINEQMAHIRKAKIEASFYEEQIQNLKQERQRLRAELKKHEVIRKPPPPVLEKYKKHIANEKETDDLAEQWYETQAARYAAQQDNVEKIIIGSGIVFGAMFILMYICSIAGG